MAWVRDIASFYDFIGYVVLRAPNRFPVEDYLPQDEQMTLDKAFLELKRGLAMVDAEDGDAHNKVKLSSLLDASLAAYRGGDEMRGAHLLQEFEGMIFKK